jgi:multiple antibiotic resistance protein
MMDSPSLFTMIIGLFAMTGPIAGLPVFITTTEGQDAKERRKTTVIIVITYAVACLVALFAGNVVLKFFGVSVAALRVAGMAVIATIGWKMLNAPTVVTKNKSAESRHNGASLHHMASNTEVTKFSPSGRQAPLPSEVGVMPLGFPLYAGPGVLSVVISWSSLSSSVYMPALAAITANAGIIALFNLLAQPIGRLVGAQGLLITEKIFGLFVLAMAVASMAESLIVLFPGLSGQVAR